MTESKRTAEQTIDIENAGATVSVRMEGAEIVSVHIRGDATAEYQWDARLRQGSWIQNIGPEYTGQSDYDDVFETGMQEVRIRCSSGTASGGDQATVTISAGG